MGDIKQSVDKAVEEMDDAITHCVSMADKAARKAVEEYSDRNEVPFLKELCEFKVWESRAAGLREARGYIRSKIREN
ncbi:MAG: hypothetical protein KAS32_01765 [Candidatus Peribacteraceae bacterium]|nr:hypothetical protein [Candidatus Peribacteraceae bacterium]